MKKNVKKLLAVACACALVLCAGSPAFAAKESGGASTTIGIKIMGTTDPTIGNPDTDGWVNISIPSALPFIFNTDGTNTVPTNAKILNYTDNVAVYIKSMTLDNSTNTNWKIATAGQDPKSLAANTLVTKLIFGFADGANFATGTRHEFVSSDSGATAKIGDPTPLANTVLQIPGKVPDQTAPGEKLLKLDIERPTFVSDNDISGDVYKLTINFGYVVDAGSKITNPASLGMTVVSG